MKMSPSKPEKSNFIKRIINKWMDDWAEKQLKKLSQC